MRIAFGESDEYSFVFHKDTSIYGGWARESPIQPGAVNQATSSSHYHWINRAVHEGLDYSNTKSDHGVVHFCSSLLQPSPQSYNSRPP